MTQKKMEKLRKEADKLNAAAPCIVTEELVDKFASFVRKVIWLKCNKDLYVYYGRYGSGGLIVGNTDVYYADKFDPKKILSRRVNSYFGSVDFSINEVVFLFSEHPDPPEYEVIIIMRD